VASSEVDSAISLEELQLAARNHGLPLEALRHDVTPVGLHYLLIHFDIPHVDETTWSLEIGGSVERPLTLTLADLQARPAKTAPVTLECAGNGRAHYAPHVVSQPWLQEAVGTAEWTGTSLGPVLEEAGLAPDATEVLFTGLDRGIQGEVEHLYERSLPLAEAMRDEVMLVYGVNGRPLPPQHGFPLRVIVPGWYGMTHVKWLHSITVIGEPFKGWQQDVAYRLRSSEEEHGEPVSRMLPRALMVPPGFPDFLSRVRFVAAGPVNLTGRAWSGWGPIDRVEVSVDGGETWADAELGAPLGDFAWRGWSYEWQAEPGVVELSCRATDSTGRTQPSAADWNYDGLCNNGVQRVQVVVRGT
jgi:sulfane dehydrogenase subunit SoxC